MILSLGLNNPETALCCFRVSIQGGRDVSKTYLEYLDVSPRHKEIWKEVIGNWSENVDVIQVINDWWNTKPVFSDSYSVGKVPEHLLKARELILQATVKIERGEII